MHCVGPGNAHHHLGPIQLPRLRARFLSILVVLRLNPSTASPFSPRPAPQIFTTGTAVVVSPVGSLTYQGERRQFGEPGQPSPVALELYDQLTGLQQERYPDPFGWVYPVC